MLSTLSGALPTELSSAAITALLSGWRQTDRLLRFHTPLGPDVLLAEELRGVECVSGQAPSWVGQGTSRTLPVVGYTLQLDALSLDAHLELKKLIGQPVLLELQTDQSRTALRPLHGHVTSAQCLGSNGGMARYRLLIEPWLAFLGHGRDSAVFQDMNVLDIVQAVLGDYQSSYQGQGKLQPAWRVDVLDASVYPQRSLTTQYQESDLAFVERLLVEEGLFYWFEHTGDPTSDSLGAHTLVIADHNAAFAPNARASVRFSQSQGTIEDDTIDRWRAQRSWHTHAIEMASWDYRALSPRPIAEHASATPDGLGPVVPEGAPALLSQDTPGAYAYESVPQGQRLGLNQLQATSVAGCTVTLGGSVRAAAPGSRFTLSAHPRHDGADAQRDSFVYLSVLHHARNNLSAELRAQAKSVVKSATSRLDDCVNSYLNDSKPNPAKAAASTQPKAPEIFYRNSALVLPHSLPYRARSVDAQGLRIHPRPNVQGSQTALVIGVPGQFLSTERDHRVKVQFAWQRGANSQSRLEHPAPEGHSGAPAQDAPGSNSGASASTTGTWVRVATPLAPIAGANWGSVALPRIGQEVVVSFIDGDIDRPVIVGAVYNGQGADNQQTNQIAQGGANATGNAPMWFPGDQEASGKGGKLPGHAHNAVLSGIKTQALSASQSGAGGYNQFVFDDSPGQGRIGLQQHAPGGQGGSHSGATELNLGHLRQQTDNQRLTPTGYGFELKTHYSGAIRSGSGLLLSADKRPGNDSGAASPQMDSREAQAQLQSGQELLKSLADTAQQHKAMLPVLKGTEAKVDKLPVFVQLGQTGGSLLATQTMAAGVYAALGSAGPAPGAEKFDEQIQAINEVSGEPLVGLAYFVKTASGATFNGRTDSEGRTRRVNTKTEEVVELLWGTDALEKISEPN